MGYDIFGKSPVSVEGKYFCRSIWQWPPLVQLIVDLCPEEAQTCPGWLYNDGGGLEADDATKLAKRLEMLVTEGAIDAYCRKQNAAAQAMLDVARERHSEFDIHRGKSTGERDDRMRDYDQVTIGVDGETTMTGYFPDDDEQAITAAAAAVFSIRPSLAGAFPVTPADVEEFMRFAGASGGFSIW